MVSGWRCVAENEAAVLTANDLSFEIWRWVSCEAGKAIDIGLAFHFVTTGSV